jgi:hypothetical protein
MTLKAPFPYFGTKGSVAGLVWERLGNVRVYNEPFFGSGAVLLGRPDEPGIENVNDLDGFIANFWRAVQEEPDKVAEYADWPVNETDLHARHRWLVGQRGRIEPLLREDPHYYDCKVAGWWVWGISQWIAVGWCPVSGKPWQQMPSIAKTGMGVHQVRLKQKRPHISDNGKGVHKQGWTGELSDVMRELGERLRRVRVLCGDWKRLVGSPSVTTINGLCGVFLDPPYADTAKRDSSIYAKDCLEVAHEVREWAIAHGDDPLFRIAVCGYEGEHIFPDSWDCVAWKALGGYSNTGNGPGKENREKERLWFSPHCLKPADTLSLFDISEVKSCE